MKTRNLRAVLGTVALGTMLTAPASAITVIQAGDPQIGSGQPTPNSDAAAAMFDAIAVPTFIETFEDASADGFVFDNGVIRNDLIGGAGPLIAFNTTPGGNLVFDTRVATTFTFAAPISSFGFYMTGVQNSALTFDFFDGSAQSVSVNSYGAGAQFFGVTDLANPITSFTFNNTNDIVGFDDIRFTTAAVQSGVPEPSTWVMLILGLLGVGGAMRKARSATASRAQPA